MDTGCWNALTAESAIKSADRLTVRAVYPAAGADGSSSHLLVNPAARKKPELFSVSVWKKEQGECILLSRNTGRITPTVENYPEKRNVHHAEKN